MGRCRWYLYGWILLAGMRLVGASIGFVNNTFEIYQVKSVY